MIILDKRQYCYFCYKPVLKFSRHLKSIHKDKEEVVRKREQRDQGIPEMP